MNTQRHATLGAAPADIVSADEVNRLAARINRITNHLPAWFTSVEFTTSAYISGIVDGAQALLDHIDHDWPSPVRPPIVRLAYRRATALTHQRTDPRTGTTPADAIPYDQLLKAGQRVLDQTLVLGTGSFGTLATAAWAAGALDVTAAIDTTIDAAAEPGMPGLDHLRGIVRHRRGHTIRLTHALIRDRREHGGQ